MKKREKEVYVIVMIVFLPNFFVNFHVHGRDMDEVYKTTVEQILRESLSVGIEISVFEPNTKPAITSIRVLERYLEIIRKACEKLGIKRKQYVMFGVTDDNLDECKKALQYEEVLGLKIYPLGLKGQTVTTGTIGVSERSFIIKAAELTTDSEKVLERHCDDPQIIAKYGYKIFAEYKQNLETIAIAELFPEGKFMIPHPSNLWTLGVVSEAQQRGLKIATGHCPQYLAFSNDSSDYHPALNPVFYYCLNNLREPEHRFFQRDYVCIPNPHTIIFSDSACHTEREKIDSAVNGKPIGGLPTHLHMISEAIALAIEKKMPNHQLADILVHNALDFYGIPTKTVPTKYEVRKKTDNIVYNNGIVVNPWTGRDYYYIVKS